MASFLEAENDLVRWSSGKKEEDRLEGGGGGVGLKMAFRAETTVE